MNGAVVDQALIKKTSDAALKSKLQSKFNKQYCYLCSTHPDDLTSIPCGTKETSHFLCKTCYREKKPDFCCFCHNFFKENLVQQLFER